jgi:hypothetical protein
MSIEVSKTGDIRSSRYMRCIKTGVACRSCTSGTRQKVPRWYYCILCRSAGGCVWGSESWAGFAGVQGGRYRRVAAFVECLVVGMAQRNASTASFQGRTLFSPLALAMCTTGHDRLPHVKWARPLDSAFDLHARPRASLGSLQPSPGPP